MGFDILGNPMCSGIPDYILSEGVFSLEVSAEAAMLYMLSHALSNWGNGPSFCMPTTGFQWGLKVWVRPSEMLAGITYSGKNLWTKG